MFKLIVAVVFAAAAWGGFALGASGAQAGERHDCCGPLPTVHTYTNVYKYSHETRYRDVWKKHYFYRPQYFQHITVVHPVLFVKTITRVHHEAIGIVRPVYTSGTDLASPRVIYTSETVNINEGCVCCK